MSRLSKYILLLVSLFLLTACTNKLYDYYKAMPVEDTDQYSVRLDLRSDVSVDFREYGLVGRDEFDENEDKNLNQYLKEDDKIYRVIYVLIDNRGKQTPIYSKPNGSNDYIEVVLGDVNNEEISSVSQASETIIDGITEYKNYFVIKNEDDISEILIKSELDGLKLEGLGFYLDYERD